MVKLRCFFGLSHGRWIEIKSLEPLVAIPGPFGSTYRCCELVILPEIGREQTSRHVLVAEGHTTDKVLDWLFTFQPDHPKHLDDRNHPRELAKRGGGEVWSWLGAQYAGRPAPRCSALGECRD